MVNPQYYPEVVFNLFGDGQDQKKCLSILHSFTNKAIAARKQAMDEAGGIENLIKQQSNGGHSRMALLDLMLDMMAKGELDLEGIREEVDTFTFEGHDTTSTTLNWFLHLMGTNPHVQAKVQREIDEKMGDDPERWLTFEDLGNLKVRS